MFIFIPLAAGVFLGFMVPAILISAAHATTARLLEALRFFPRGSLVVETRSYLTGAGYQRSAKTYLSRMPGASESEATGKVFGYLLLTCQLAFLALSSLLIVALKLFA